MTPLALRPVPDALARIVRSDAIHILHLLPSYKALEFYFDASSDDVQPALCVGECGDSEVRAFPDGSVQRLIVRESRKRKKGHTCEVLGPLSEYFRAIDPFAWSPSLRKGILTPMTAPARALVQMLIHIWAITEKKTGFQLPDPIYEDLHQALMMIQKDLEIESILPQGQRTIPSNILDKYAKIKSEASKVTSADAVDSKIPTVATLSKTEQDKTLTTLATSLPTIPSTGRVIPPEYRASAAALMDRLYGRRKDPSPQGGNLDRT